MKRETENAEKYLKSFVDRCCVKKNQIIKINKIFSKKSTNFENVITKTFTNNQQKSNYINVVDYNDFALFKFFKN